jgi:FkbM family methyltransferase
MNKATLVQTQEGWWVLSNDPCGSVWIKSQRRIDHEEARVGLELVWPHVRPGSTVIDVGANLGAWTIPMLRAVGEGGTVVSYEPDPQVAECLRRNISKEISDMGRTVVSDLRERCVSDTAGTISFLVNTQDRGGNAARDIHVNLSGTLIPIEKEKECLDDQDFRNVSVLKIDVEGLEKKVLSGAHRLIAMERPVMWIECFEIHGDPEPGIDRTYTEIKDLVSAMGYSVRLFPDNELAHDALCIPL